MSTFTLVRNLWWFKISFPTLFNVLNLIYSKIKTDLGWYKIENMVKMEYFTSYFNRLCNNLSRHCCSISFLILWLCMPLSTTVFSSFFPPNLSTSFKYTFCMLKLRNHLSNFYFYILFILLLLKNKSIFLRNNIKCLLTSPALVRLMLCVSKPKNDVVSEGKGLSCSALPVLKLYTT